MKQIFTILAILAASLTSFAKGDWKGKVLDENGEPLPYVNVVLLSKADSTVLGGVTTEADGTFYIKTDQKEGLMMVAMLGYQTQYMTPANDAVIKLVPDNNMLEGAVKSAIMPKTKLTGEGLQTAVRGSVLENVGSAKDVLERTPGMVRTQDGLQVIGKGAPMYYINGRKVTDANELDRLQSHEIQSIEVISNPGAQYDASIRSVVRIRTIKRQGEGFGFDISTKDEQSLRYHPAISCKGDMMPDNDPSVNFNMNYRKNNVDIFGGVNLFKFSSRQESDIFTETFGTPSFNNKGYLFNYYIQKTAAANTGINWQISPAHSIGFKVDYSTNYDVPSYQVVENDITMDGSMQDKVTTIGNYSNGSFNPYSVATNTYYNGVVGKMEIDLNFDYYTMGDSRISINNERSESTPDATISTNSESRNNLYATKLVLSYPIWMGKFQLGTEESFSRRSDDYNITGTGIPASSSKVNEDSYAGFANYAFYIPKVGQMSAGIRYEHVDYDYIDANVSDSFSKTYNNFFPTLSYANAFGPVQVMASYSAKTRRPNFSMLSSAIRYNNKFILQSGNAALQQEIVNDFNITSVYKWFTFVANYSRTDNPITTWSSLYNDEGVMLVQPRNLEKPMRNLSAFAVATPTVGIWNINLTLGIVQQWLTIDAPDPRVPGGIRVTKFNDHPMGVGRIYNTLSFKHDWQLEFGADVTTKGYTQNLYLENNSINLTAGVQKAFLKDKSLIVRLEGKDLAGLAYFNVRSDFGSVAARQTNIMDTQRVILSVKYRFNSAQSKYKGTGAGQDAANRMK